MFTKPIAAFLAITVLFTIAIPVIAAPTTTGPTINVADVTANVGDTVLVPVNIDNNPGIVTMRLYVEYDETALKLVKISDTGILGSQIHSNKFASPFILFWENGSGGANISANGEVAILHFEALSRGASDITISYSNDDIFNISFEDIPFRVNNGKVSVGIASGQNDGGTGTGGNGQGGSGTGGNGTGGNGTGGNGTSGNGTGGNGTSGNGTGGNGTGGNGQSNNGIDNVQTRDIITVEFGEEEAPLASADEPEATIYSPMQPIDAAGTSVAAIKSSNKLIVGNEEKIFPAAVIHDYNWLKLRDLAMILLDSGKGYSLDYDDLLNAIILTTGGVYTPVGDELQGLHDEFTAIASPQKLYVDGEYVDLAAFNIEGYNYFRLRDLAIILDFAVEFTAGTGVATLDLEKPYRE